MGEIVEKAGDALLGVGEFVYGVQLKILGGLFPKEPKRTTSRDIQDRTITAVDSESPHTYIYGRARVGSAVVAVLTSGARDEYKHIVCVHAAHECHEIEEIYIAGRPLGALDGNGNVTTGDYFITSKSFYDYLFTGTSGTLPHTPDAGSVRVFVLPEFSGVYVEIFTGFTIVGTSITTVDSGNYKVNYSTSSGTPYVRVSKHLGAPNQAADAGLIAEIPAKWDANRKLSGMCYTVIRLNLNFRDFQSGMPEIEALIKGRKLHDVRSGSYPNDAPAWSQNPALIIADYLTSEMCAVPWTDLPLADFIAAANVCDESTIYGTKYLANGVVTSDDKQSEVLNQLSQSMAGSIVSTTWGVQAGKYIAPVLSLSQSDIVGEFSYTAGVPESDLFNGIKGQYISSANLYVATDFQPYTNASYVTADGQDLWSDIDFMFTDEKQRVHNLARILMEDQRNAFTITADFSYKAWDLKIGQRVTFTSSLLGQTNKVYRLLNKTFGPTSAVQLTLKEDAESIWDLADAVLADETPNTDLPNPFTVGVPGNLQVTEQLYETTGSSGVKVKLTVSWDAPADAAVQDYELTYKSYLDADFVLKYFTINETVEILDVADGKYDFRVRARNHLNLFSDWTAVKTVTVYGLYTPPGNVLNFTVKPFNGSALCNWTRTVDLDVKIGGDVEIRFCPLTIGASWEQSIILPDGKFNGDATSAFVPLATGTYYAKFIDSTGQYSATPASFVATESLVRGWSTVATSTQHTAFSGSKTGVAVLDGKLKLDGTSLVSEWGLMSTLGYIGSIGGITQIGTYLFDATLDLSTISTRRFHTHIKSLSYNAADFISLRGLVSTWNSVIGDVINDTNATVWISVSDDDLTYTDWVPFMVSDFNCRYAKFKAILESYDVTHNIDISELSISVKIPV